MKQIVAIVLALALLLSLAACGSQAPDRRQTVNQAQTVDDVLQQVMESENTPTQDAASGQENSSRFRISSLFESYDVDLTTMSGTMIFTEVLQMMQSPELYIGKSVKMMGTFAIYEGEERNY